MDLPIPTATALLMASQNLLQSRSLPQDCPTIPTKQVTLVDSRDVSAELLAAILHLEELPMGRQRERQVETQPVARAVPVEVVVPERIQMENPAPAADSVVEGKLAGIALAPQAVHLALQYSTY